MIQRRMPPAELDPAAAILYSLLLFCPKSVQPQPSSGLAPVAREILGQKNSAKSVQQERNAITLRRHPPCDPDADTSKSCMTKALFPIRSAHACFQEHQLDGGTSVGRTIIGRTNVRCALADLRCAARISPSLTAESAAGAAAAEAMIL